MINSLGARFIVTPFRNQSMLPRKQPSEKILSTAIQQKTGISFTHDQKRNRFETTNFDCSYKACSRINDLSIRTFERGKKRVERDWIFMCIFLQASIIIFIEERMQKHLFNCIFWKCVPFLFSQHTWSNNHTHGPTKRQNNWTNN